MHLAASQGHRGVDHGHGFAYLLRRRPVHDQQFTGPLHAGGGTSFRGLSRAYMWRCSQADKTRRATLTRLRRIAGTCQSSLDGFLRFVLLDSSELEERNDPLRLWIGVYTGTQSNYLCV